MFLSPRWFRTACALPGPGRHAHRKVATPSQGQPAAHLPGPLASPFEWDPVNAGSLQLCSAPGTDRQPRLQNAAGSGTGRWV